MNGEVLTRGLQVINGYSGLIAALVTLLVGLLALYQWRVATRWRQGEEGRKLIDELFLGDKHGGYDALLMTEPGIGEYLWYEDSKGKHYTKVSHEEAIAALTRALVGKSQEEKDDFIRECFDDLFYYLERIELFLENRFITYNDVCSPLAYYEEQMAKNSEDYKVYKDYIKKIRAGRADRFLNRLKKERTKGKVFPETP
jgi:hypothetical protein